MIQTLNFYNWPWISGNINQVIYDLEQHGCEVKDVRAIGLKDGFLNQIIFESGDLITYTFNFSYGSTEMTIYDGQNKIIAKYNACTF